MTLFWHSILAWFLLAVFFIMAWITVKSLDKARHWREVAKSANAFAEERTVQRIEAERDRDLWANNAHAAHARALALEAELERVKRGIKLVGNRALIDGYALHFAPNDEVREHMRQRAIEQARYGIAKVVAQEPKVRKLDMPHLQPGTEVYEAYMYVYMPEEVPPR